MNPSKCPKCGHQIVTLAYIGLPGLGYICPMNMPFQGCGWRSTDKLKGH